MAAKADSVATLDPLADEYEKSVDVGTEFLSRCWRNLGDKTRNFLTASNFLGENGRPLPLDEREKLGEAEDLAYSLGVLQRCVNANLSRGTKKAPSSLPLVALKPEVLVAAGSLMHGYRNQEVEFLRLALMAIRQHQIATTLTRLPTFGVNGFDFLGLLKLGLVLLHFLFLLLLPAFLGIALVASAKGDEAGAIFACYGIGVAYFLRRWVKNLSAESQLSNDELAYQYWLNLGGGIDDGPWLAGGPGAATYLAGMVRKGVKVPPVAIDLCEMLTARIVRS